MVFCVSCGHKLAGRYCGQCGGDSQSTADAQAEVPVLTVPAGGAKKLLTRKDRFSKTSQRQKVARDASKRKKQDEIMGAALLTKQTPPPLEPWRPPNPTLMEGIFFYQQTHEGELQQKKTQDDIKKAFEDAGITPFKEGQWKQYVESSFLPKGSPAASHVLHEVHKPQHNLKMPSVHIALN